MRSFVNGIISWTSLFHINAKSRPPLGETGSLFIMPDAFVVKIVKTRAPGFPLDSPDKRLKAGINLDSRDDSVGLQHVNKGSAISGILIQGLFKKNSSRNIVTKIRCGKEELAPLSITKEYVKKEKEFV
jgi:hypothetical protein